MQSAGQRQGEAEGNRRHGQFSPREKGQVGSRLWTQVASGESGLPSALNQPLRGEGSTAFPQEVLEEAHRAVVPTCTPSRTRSPHALTKPRAG